MGKAVGTKPATSAVEKIIELYGGDVSLLKDICRQTIVFENVGDMVRCLKALLVDPEVLVMRVKNGMDPASSAYDTLGFRR